MKSIGIVRRIDDLGRIVIPKEIRKALRIREGDTLEILLDKSGEIILKKFSAIQEMVMITTEYAEILAKTTGFSVIITDTDKVMSISGSKKENYLLKDITKNVIKIMNDRSIWTTQTNEPIILTNADKCNKYASQIIVPIISDANTIGTVILFTEDTSKKLTQIECKFAQMAADFIGKQFI